MYLYMQPIALSGVDMVPHTSSTHIETARTTVCMRYVHTQCTCTCTQYYHLYTLHIITYIYVHVHVHVCTYSSAWKYACSDLHVRVLSGRVYSITSLAAACSQRLGLTCYHGDFFKMVLILVNNYFMYHNYVRGMQKLIIAKGENLTSITDKIDRQTDRQTDKYIPVLGEILLIKARYISCNHHGYS